MATELRPIRLFSHLMFHRFLPKSKYVNILNVQVSPTCLTHLGASTVKGLVTTKKNVANRWCVLAVARMVTTTAPVETLCSVQTAKGITLHTRKSGQVEAGERDSDGEGQAELDLQRRQETGRV